MKRNTRNILLAIDVTLGIFIAFMAVYGIFVVAFWKFFYWQMMIRAGAYLGLLVGIIVYIAVTIDKSL